MSKKTLAAGTSPFAHLIAGAAALARGTRASRTAAEEENKDPDAEEDKEEPDAEDPDKDPDAEDPDNDPDAEDPDKDPDAEDEESDADAEEPKDDKEAKGFRDGRTAERKRCRAIFASKAAAGRPDLAAQLAFETRMSSAEAIGVLAAAGPAATPRGRTLTDRMGTRRDPNPGADAGGASGGKGTKLSQAMIAVGTKLGQVAAK